MKIRENSWPFLNSIYFSVAWSVAGSIEPQIKRSLKIDRAGWTVVPKQIRQRLGLKPNTEIEIVEQADGVLLRRLEQQASRIKSNRR
jgi:AbrB family looped-hinge helix DNA binding protein